jgi:L-lactate dehydrogenase complex protein LldG
MGREAFMKRVRDAAAAGRAYRVHPSDFPADAGYQGAGDDPVDRFATEATEVGGKVHVVANLAEAAGKLREILDTVAPQSALCWEHDVLDRMGLPEILTDKGIEQWTHARLVLLPHDEQRSRMFAADIGISGVTWAVAETGSIAMASGPGTERLASLLPAVHVAIVERHQLLPDLFDLFRKYDAEGGGTLPSNLTMITGPSKTGDIELRLTTGVHGPGVWHVIVVR